MSVGDNIRALREARNMKQCELAEAVHVSPSMVTQLERGSKLPSIVLAAEIANALGVEVGELIGNA